MLGLIATGKTNRVIADALGLSEKTVARHVSNIFMKLGISTRAQRRHMRIAIDSCEVPSLASRESRVVSR